MGGGVFGIECEGLLEGRDRFAAASEDGEEEADFVLYRGGFGIERGGVAVGGEGAGGVAGGFEGGGAGHGFLRGFGGGGTEGEAKNEGEETHAGLIIRGVACGTGRARCLAFLAMNCHSRYLMAGGGGDSCRR